MEAPTHPRQNERLQLLRSFDILDTEREADFDDIVKLASQICETPISVVNLIDADRQWFKAETGLGVRETPLSTSLCSHVILEQDFVEIPDTLDDPRMRDNPLCLGTPGLRFYAGAVLTTEEGLPLGTLCVLDYRPRRLSDLQRQTLRVLARQVVAQLVMRKALKRNKLLRQEIDHRVKNSLQSLSALVRIQQRRAQSAETDSALASIHSRIEAVAQLHEQLYRSDYGRMIDISEYLGRLVQHFSEMAPPNVRLILEAEECLIPPAQAVAVGTLVNEFVANSLKHAFPGGKGGEIHIKLAEGASPGMVRLGCRDTGVGLPPDADAGQAGLGMLIAQVISAELQTDLQIETLPSGLSVSLEFQIAAMPE